jgi:uncharacterized cupredoxin-like copper-binding protein
MNTTTHRSPRTPAILGGVLLLVVAGCASSGGDSAWTFSPPAATSPVASPGAGSPSGSPAGSPGGSPGASPSGSPATSPSGSPAGSPGGSPGASATAGAANTIELVETEALEIQQDGQKVTAIPLKQGETYTFRINNPSTALQHNFWIGTDAELQANQTGNMEGVPDFTNGTQEFQYTASEPGPLKFGCTVPGHLQFMQGDIQIQP